MSLTNKFNFKDPNKDIELVNLSICYTRKHIKSAYNYNKLSDNKISAPTWNYVFSWPDGSHSNVQTQGYFEYINKKH